MAQRPYSYKQAGVDLQAADQLVGRIAPLLRRTYGPRVLDRHGLFAGLFCLDYEERLFRRSYRQPVLVGCTDGVGSKVLVAAGMGRLDTVGIDLVAMSVNDAICGAVLPLAYSAPMRVITGP